MSILQHEARQHSSILFHIIIIISTVQELLLISAHKFQEKRKGCEGNENEERRERKTYNLRQPILISFMK